MAGTLLSLGTRPPFPITVDLVKCVGASLTEGGYYACSLYFGAAVGHQLRTTGTPVGEDVHWAIRDTVRAIKRGVLARRLKESFDIKLVPPIVPYSRQRSELHVGQLDAEIDLALVAGWWMLREIEVSNSRAHHLYLSGDRDFHVHFLVPIQGGYSRPTDGAVVHLHLSGSLRTTMPMARCRSSTMSTVPPAPDWDTGVIPFSCSGWRAPLQE